ncbi:hypothetical protein [Nonomuraea jabiensis]|uniref:hypothetical protein n=1 Tax=Nonomuraea jabiensis TaxID=882448 RepID=UPI003D746299
MPAPGRSPPRQQLISYYFDGNEGLYQAISERWRERENDLITRDMPIPEQIRRYALEALNNPDGVRLLAWSTPAPETIPTTHPVRIG